MASLAMSVASVASLSASPITYGQSRAELMAMANVELAASPATYGTGICELSVSELIFFAASPATYATGLLDLTGGNDTRGMSFCDVVSDIISLWGVHCRKSAPKFVLDRATADINAAVQTVWNQADERAYWSSSSLAISIPGDTFSLVLGDDVQNVIGPCRLATTKRPLVPIGTIGEFESFSDLYLEGETSTESLAYHIDRANQTGEEPVKLTFMVTPTSAETQNFILEIVKEAPRYSAADLIICPVIPIPHRYVETLLLPIARYHASSFEMFMAKDQKESIDRDYLVAMKALGHADSMPGKAAEKFETRKESAKQ